MQPLKYTCLVIFILILKSTAFAQSDSLYWQHHLAFNTGLYLSGLSEYNDGFKNKDKISSGLEFGGIYGFNTSKNLGLEVGINIVTAERTISKSNSSFDYYYKESFLKFPLQLTSTYPLRCKKCDKRTFFLIKYGTYISVSNKQTIGQKDFFTNTKTTEKWGYYKAGISIEFSFIISNMSNEKQGYGANHVFGIRFNADNYNSLKIMESNFENNGFITPMYNSLILYYNITNAFYFKSRKSKIKKS